MNALEAFEEMANKPFGDIDAGRMKELKILVYCALKEADPEMDLTLEQVGKYATPKEVGKVSKRMVSFMTGEEKVGE